MKSYEVTKIGQHRGKPPLWLEGSKAQLGGFMPGKRFEAKKDLDKQMLILELSYSGCRIVSRKLKGERELPVIDINSGELLSVFDGIEAVRVVVQDGKIFILPLATEIAVKERLGRLKGKAGLRLADPGGLPLAWGRGVVACHSCRTERGRCGSEACVANEIREELLE